jgi:hypothetical protein
MFGYSPPPKEPNLLSRDVWRFVQVSIMHASSLSRPQQSLGQQSASTAVSRADIHAASPVLQRLDLSTPIKNPRRDFSNGFLAAEMMARFHVSSTGADSAAH